MTARASAVRLTPAPAAVLAGLGSWLPPRLVSNAELALRFDTSDDWITTRTGIRQRYVVPAGMSTVDMAVEAGARAMKSAGVFDIDAVILATTTPDYLCPGSAPEAASRLGLSGVAAMDVGAVCSGFIYALATGTGLIRAGVVEQALVIGADAFSTILDPADPSTNAVFGDGAAAVVLRGGLPGELGAIGPFDLGSCGDDARLIWVPAGGSRQRSHAGPVPARDHYFQMQGRQVFRQAVGRMAESARRAVSRAGWRMAQVDRFVGHQANARILAAIAAELGLDAQRVVTNIASVANTAAASIPLALADATRLGHLQPGQNVLLCAFGGGTTWGATTLRWPALAVS